MPSNKIRSSWLLWSTSTTFQASTDQGPRPKAAMDHISYTGWTALRFSQLHPQLPPLVPYHSRSSLFRQQSGTARASGVEYRWSLNPLPVLQLIIRAICFCSDSGKECITYKEYVVICPLSAISGLPEDGSEWDARSSSFVMQDFRHAWMWTTRLVQNIGFQLIPDPWNWYLDQFPYKHPLNKPAIQ